MSRTVTQFLFFIFLGETSYMDRLGQSRKIQFKKDSVQQALAEATDSETEAFNQTTLPIVELSRGDNQGSTGAKGDEQRLSGMF